MNNFDSYIDRAIAKGHKDLAKRMRMEKRMASALVRACLARGFEVTIDNGEDRPIERSTSYKAIMGELWQTDEEHVLIFKDGKRHGWFFLVYGNDGYDLIADYSDNPVCNSIWEEDITPVSDKLVAGL
jgi:hypothetical protein